MADPPNTCSNARRIGAWILLLAAAFPVRAESLAEAIEQAWSRHPQAAALAARQDEAHARADLAAGLTPGAPSLSLSSRSDRFSGNRGAQEWEVEVAVPLWLPGQQNAREAEAHSASREIAAHGRALRLQLAGELRAAWWQLAAARSARDLAALRNESARGLEMEVRRRYQAGDLPRIDANLAQGEHLAAQADEVEAGSAVVAAEQAWRALTGRPAPAVLDDLPALPGPALSDAHPQLAAASAAADTARGKLRVAEQTRRDAPELTLSALRARGDNADNYANQVGVKLTLPLSSAPRVSQENAAARAELNQLEADLALLRLKLELDADRARHELAAADRQLALARERRALAADTLRLTEKSFELGEADLRTLLLARAAAREAEGALARLQVARAAAQSQLEQALGVLP